MSGDSKITLTEGRFSRLEAIQWWDRDVVRDARVMVVGAGALGNEIIKNLCLLGIGHLLIIDMDRVEISNLSRSVLFRLSDQGRLKAEVAAAAARELHGDVDVRWIAGNVLSDVGLGHFRWAHVVAGALDNREARVFVNSACAQVGRPWVDGGIDVLSGIVRGFAPPETACYECTMGQADWDLLAKRRSCSLLARKALAEGGTPTTPTTASVVGAIQAQEILKRLHGMECLSGGGFVFEGLTHNSYAVTYPKSPDCPWHQAAPAIERFEDCDSDVPLSQVWKRAEARIGSLDALDLSRELVETLECPGCGHVRRVLVPIDRISEDQAVCGKCRTECVPRFVHSVGRESSLLTLSARDLGLPVMDILWARGGETVLGIELADRDEPSQGGV